MDKQDLIDRGAELSKKAWPDTHSQIVFRTTWNKAVELLWPTVEAHKEVIHDKFEDEFLDDSKEANDYYNSFPSVKALSALESKVKK